MKRLAMFLILLLMIAVFVFAFSGKSGDVLRLHVLANSDAAADVSVKQEIVELVNAYIAENFTGESLDETLEFIKSNIEEIKNLILNYLSKAGLSYGVDITLKTDDFPSRSYGSVYFPSGEYSALVITLGEGEGDNWWCVLYPRLCYGKDAGSVGIIYRSRLVEAYRKIFKESK